MDEILFKPLKVGDLTLPNRIVLAPLTRQRAGSARVPNELMREYYSQRAGAGLILTEATIVDASGAGYKDTPGIYTDEQVAGWKKITDAVHERGGRIFMQLWHVGRVSDPYFLNGNAPVAPSAIAPSGHVSLLRPQRGYVTPRALATHEVKEIVQWFKRGAENAKRAGFDGVEIHGANGYLVDQFLQSKTNQRSDEYGGPIENRARFLLEIVDAAIGVWGPGRVGVHLAPASDSHDIGDANPRETFGYVARELGRRKIAFIFAREGARSEYLTPYLKKEFGGVMIANQGLNPSRAAELITSGEADAAAWGRSFISNPDLVTRIRLGRELSPADPSTFYTEGAAGYTDYPAAT